MPRTQPRGRRYSRNEKLAPYHWALREGTVPSRPQVRWTSAASVLAAGEVVRRPSVGMWISPVRVVRRLRLGRGVLLLLLLPVLRGRGERA